MCVNLCAKFEVSSIILTSFKQGGNPPPPPQKEPLKSPPRLWLNACSSVILDSLNDSFCLKRFNFCFPNNTSGNEIMITVLF